jgi:hypothetical protein
MMQILFNVNFLQKTKNATVISGGQAGKYFFHLCALPTIHVKWIRENRGDQKIQQHHYFISD